MTLKDYLVRLKGRFVVWIGIYGLWVCALTSSSIFEGNALTALAKFNIAGFLSAAAIYIGTNLVEAALSAGAIVYGYHLQRHLNNAIRSDIADNFTRMSYPEYHQRSDAVYTSWMTNDINTLDHQGMINMGYLLQASWQIAASALVLFTYNPTLIISTALLAILLLTVPLIYRKRLSAAAAKWSQQNERLTNQITDVLEGFNTLFMANRRNLLVQRIWHASDEAGRANYQYIQFDMLTQFAINVVNLAAQVTLLVQAGLLAYNRLIPIGAVLTIHNLAGSTFSGLTLMSFALTTIKSVKPILEKFAAAVVPAPAKKQTVAALTNAIQLDHVTYHYPGNNPAILQDFNLTVPVNQKLAIVGPSGKGKSTILKLLSAALPDYQGRLTWDDQDYTHLDADTLRDQLTYIDQAPYIFNDTIRFNITLGNTVSDKELQKVIAECQLTDFVTQQPNGVDTVLDHNGTNISGGQKQRIALARGLIRHSKVIISDEGTAALDPKNASAVEQLLVNLPNTTLIMVTHNLRHEIKARMDQVITI
jgi:ATP-binding cassette subfamily B protein